MRAKATLAGQGQLFEVTGGDALRARLDAVHAVAVPAVRPNPVVALARAIARGEALGPAEGLHALDGIADRERLTTSSRCASRPLPTILESVDTAQAGPHRVYRALPGRGL